MLSLSSLGVLQHQNENFCAICHDDTQLMFDKQRHWLVFSLLRTLQRVELDHMICNCFLLGKKNIKNDNSVLDNCNANV